MTLAQAVAHTGLPALPRRASTADAVAGVLRTQIAEGKIRPGAQLREEHIAGALEVSRNTVREAFRLLSHERLVEHALHRGVFVRVVGADEIREMYHTRRLVEPLGVHRILGEGSTSQLTALRTAVEAAETAAEAGDWAAVGTANTDFHRCLVAAGGSVHLSRMFEGLLAELRLAFLLLPEPRALHEPFVARNRHILVLLEAGDVAGCLEELDCYLTSAETRLLGQLGPAAGE